ncbi:MAG: hypothetical protein CMG24_04715 [Candidatus Marinimicrobia bacterium]|nr:hypothetical protein [Candidatus Neomarinimicrobiota bacterium]
MNIKKYIMNISLMVIVSILFTQNLDLFTQKITLENSLRDKIYSELERVLNKNKNRFVVVVNLELGKYGDLISQNKNDNKGNQNSRGMEYLPGVPLSGSKGISKNNSTQRRIGANDYIISEIDISIYIEQSLATGSNEKMIESLVKGIIPQTSNCDDCITIETMNFQTQNSEDTELQKLRKELEAFKESERKRQLTELNVQLADLQARLEDSENERMTWEDYERRRDSIKVAHWEEAKAQEEIVLKEQLQTVQNKLDTAINQRIESETQTKNDLIDIIGGRSNDPLSMQGRRSGGTSPFIYLAIFLIIIIVIAFLFILINKKSVVYLKPKGDSPNNDNASSPTPADNNNDTAATQNQNANENSSNLHQPTNTTAMIDDSVVQSELKALRQSSIAMSASQKEGATQIVKDWIDDGMPADSSEENDKNEGGE